MKKLIFLILLITIAFFSIPEEKAECLDCGQTTACYDNSNCAYHCFCYKSTYNYQGRCLPK